jgi:hypothetical protein
MVQGLPEAVLEQRRAPAARASIRGNFFVANTFLAWTTDQTPREKPRY